MPNIAGVAVSSAGDVNGDGFDDIVVGTPFNGDGGVGAGAAYLIFGRANGFSPIDLRDLESGDGYRIQGDRTLDHAGSGVSGLGDVNGDGLDDFIVAASRGWTFDDPSAQPTIAYVIFGKQTATPIDLTSLAASDGFVVNGSPILGTARFTLAGPGDVNGDGIADIILGAQDDGTGNRAVYVIFGKTSGLATTDVSNLPAGAGFTIHLAPSLGGSFDVATADMNGDGFADIIVSAVRESINDDAFRSQAYVYFGKSANFGDVSLGYPEANDFVIQEPVGSWFEPWTVSSAGDINGDGFDDIILASPNAYDQRGAAYVIFGKATGFSPINVANLSPGDGFLIKGDALLDPGGIGSVSGAGDINGDGFDDVIISASGADIHGADSGLVYVIFGKPSGLGTIDLAHLPAAAGLIFEGVWAGSAAGWDVGVGDINHDGFDDLLIGAGDGVGGSVHVVFGRAAFTASDVEHAVNDFDGNGFSDILFRNDAGQVSNWVATAAGGFSPNPRSPGPLVESPGVDWKVAAIGDFNGDRRVDILWRQDGTGQVNEWLTNGDGSYKANALATTGAALDWHVVGVGDFNGDGRSDILWEQNGGLTLNWLSEANGGFASNAGNFATVVGTEWRVIANGDYNGDGLGDILWRKDGTGEVMDWLATSNGGFVTNSASTVTVGTDWHISGSGDFNGDGIDDILWRQNGGLTLDWLGNSSGTFASNAGNFSTVIGTEWRVVGVGDYNGDGHDDILWKQDGTGHMTNWIATAEGSFNTNAAIFDTNLPGTANIQDPFLPFI